MYLTLFLGHHPAFHHLKIWLSGAPHGCQVHHMAVRCTTWLSGAPHGCQVHDLAFRCTAWLSGAPHGCQVHRMAARCTIWLSGADSCKWIVEPTHRLKTNWQANKLGRAWEQSHYWMCTSLLWMWCCLAGFCGGIVGSPFDVINIRFGCNVVILIGQTCVWSSAANVS